MKAVLGNIIFPQIARACDTQGCGHYLADRVNNRKHKGIDVRTTSGQSVHSPIDGIVVHNGIAYLDDTRYKTVHIIGSGDCYNGILVKMFYVQSFMPTGTVVTRGQIIGTAQNIAAKYKGITNHVHFEVFYNSIRQNPTNLFGDCIDQTEQPVEVAETQGDGFSNTITNKYIHYSENDTKVEDFLNQIEFANVELTKQQLLDILIEGKTNHRRLYDALPNSKKKQYNNQSLEYSSSADYPITSGAVIHIPVYSVVLKDTYQSNITVTKTSFNDYFPPVLKHLTNDPGYIAAERNYGAQVNDVYPQATVWLWSRTRYLEGESGWVDITKHIHRVNTSTSLTNGGQFTLDVATIAVRSINQEGQDRWEDNASQSVNVSSVAREAVFKTKGQYGSEFRSQNFLYSSIVQQNDLVFIAYEKFLFEKQQLEPNNRWYEMIGMVDSVELSSSFENSSITTTIRGRDFTKAFLDDNSYFNPYSIGNRFGVYGNEFGKNGRYLDGSFKEVSAFINRSVQETVEFIVHRIATIGYVPDDVFDLFQNKTSNVKGVWQLCKVFVDNTVKNLKLVDDSVSNPQGTINDLFNKIAQPKLMEFFTDYYGDKFYLIFREPPFTRSAVIDAVWNVDQLDESFESFRSAPQNIQGRPSQDKLNDYIEKEKLFFKDKPKPTKDEEPDLILDQAVIADAQFPRLININALDVISESLNFSNESYAWYKITDRGNFADATVNLGTIPALYLDSVAQVFGNRMLDITSNYSDYRFFQHKRTAQELDLYAEQASQHLAFLVETHIYLPFTRQGTIRVNGDRRIKKGNWIYYRPTQEIFYVTAVDHDLNITETSIERTTVISVERGMRKEFIKPTDVTIDGETVEVSYFNIVDIPKLRKGIYDVVSGGSANEKFDHKANILINQKVFDFFLQKREQKNYYAFED